ncbi:transcriptional regulator PpsR [Bosea sp. AAP35]|uniref:transcriptional regulator PpsR n=1 Tax=Bosea sp. AAP35 TaxID=1523417 RepID=UPI0012E1E77D|nr:transcriptional regulator PpsR [Bosea sp. AAP35]
MNAGLLNKEWAFVAMSSGSSHNPSTEQPAGELRSDALSPFARQIITAASDIAVLLDSGGRIASVVSLHSTGARADWIGRHFSDVVSPDSQAKALDLIEGAASEPGRVSEINHPAEDGVHQAFRYKIVRDGHSGARCLVGQDLLPIAALQQRLIDAQQLMEREYARLRLAETRYRMIFHSSSEPILIADSVTFKLLEANPAALSEFAVAADRIGKITLPSLFAPTSADALETMLATARVSGEGQETDVSRPGTKRKTWVRATAFRQDGAINLLVRLRFDAQEPDIPAGDTPLRHLHGMVEQTPDGCVIISPERIIVHANKAFLELAQLASRHQAIGEPLDRWLGRPGIDLPMIQETLADHGVIRNFPTIIRGAFGSVETVELSAVTAWAGDAGSTGLIIRSKGAQTALQAPRGQALPRSVEQLSQLVGRTPLKDIVRETSDVIEKLCIESALDLSKDNRAAAAQMLGLSRQSFYAKLRRHGLGDLDDENDPL